MKPRKRKCKGCGEPFMPFNSLQKACSPTCALDVARAEREKKARKEHQEAKKRIKPRSQWMREAQAAFNAFIRERDHDQPCISCGATPNYGSRGGDWDCGHYRSVGANPELRFCELNAHKQCKKCNQYLSGNHVNYRIGLIERIGQEKVDWLEGPHEAQKWSKAELEQIAIEYRARTRALQKERRNAA